MKYHIVTMGCQMNVADSNEMSTHLEAKGLSATASLEEADLVVVNTCTVRQQAEHRALSLLGRLKAWKKAKEGRVIVLTGCAAERIKGQVSWRLPQVDLTVGAKDIERFGERVEELLRSRFDWVAETEATFNAQQSDPLTPALSPGGERELNFQSASATSPIAYVTIMRGCNYSCSYCIVPAVRGREIYRVPETILSEIKNQVEAGAREALLLGQTVNSYHYDGYDFARLLKEVDSIPGLERIRYMSPHPHYMDKATIDTMAGLPTVCEHVHLPVQSGSDPMLKRMKRNYTRARYMEAAGHLRKRIPGVSITTDIIVGFPGETEDDFKETLSLIQEADFDSAYCFKYSPRPGTLSAEWPDDVLQETKEERLARLLEITEAQAAKHAEKMVGSEQEILVETVTIQPPHLNPPPRRGEEIKFPLPTGGEGGGEGKMAVGRTRGNWSVKVKLPQGSKIKIGNLVPIKITQAHGRALEGDICSR